MKPQAKPAAVAGGSKIDLSWAAENQPVWVMLAEDDPSGEACAKGTIVKVIDDDNAQVKVDGEKEAKALRGDKIYPLNNYKDYPKGYDDMVDMENLSEAELLNNLRIRFTGEDMIYTYVGPTLIVLNPYKRIDKLLVPTVLSNYQDALLSGKFELKEHAPHVYAISATAMKNMFDNKKNQAIVISGESGAGKTENTKSAMKFLTSLGKSAADSSSSKEENIEDKILACNPVLEAFGNAKTVRNDNSSRFGKYVSLLIEKNSKKIVGATITNYLLEKSRVVSQNSEERNYHIFYAFLRGASEETLKRFELTKSLDDWNFLKNAFKGVVPTVPDDELYKEVTDSFNTMNFSTKEQDAVWAYTAASLMIGNIDFDESTFTDNTPCDVKNDVFLKKAAKVLDVDFEKLSKSLRYKTRTVGTQVFESTQKRDECLIFRDSLSKDLFNKLFNWLVKRLNYTVLPPEAGKGGMDVASLMNKYYHIGLLDIFGFEIFNFNSIEQFCINFANEKLQQLYISYVFKGEEKEFILEGLKDFIGELSFKDNQGLIDMLDHGKLPGIFQMVDESCSVSQTDQNLYDKIIKQFKKPEFPLTTQKIAKDTFIVKHTAKEVEYNINGFRAKNKDEISKTIEEAICGSTNTCISDVWKSLCLGEVESEDAKAKPNPKDKFLGFKFRSQMKELMDELNSCECHFIRCLKPNEKKQANFFLPQLVLQQIKYMGILDTIKVRKDSFPVRTPYKSFYEKYQELDPIASRTPFEKHVENGADFKEMARAICQKKVPHLGTQQILYGNNKMFLRVEASKEVEKLRRDWINLKHKSARKIQKAWFYFKHHRLFKNMQKGVGIVQKLFRVSKEYLKFVKLRKKTVQIQGWWRRILFRRLVKRRHKLALHIQAWWKKVYYTALHKKTLAAIKSMNRFIKGGLARKKVRTLKLCKAIVESIVDKGAAALWRKVEIKAAKTIQRYARGYICRQEHKEKVAQIKWAKDNFVKNKIARRLQKHAKRFIVQASFKRIRKAASFIQGYMKTKWLSTLFQRLRVVSVQIQKAVRRWLIRNKVVRERMLEFVNMEGKMYQNLIINEQAHFFGAENVGKNGQYALSQNTKESTQLYTEGLVTNITENSMMMDALPTESAPFETIPTDPYLTQTDVVKTARLNTTKEVDPYGSKKINLFSKVLDIEILSDTSLIYDPMWSLQVLQLQKDCGTVDADIQLVEVGQAHTTIVASTNKVYSFGWNDRFQLGRMTSGDQEISQIGQVNFGVDNFRPKTTAAGDDHNLALDHQGNLYVWGDNNSGQLGLGHCRDTKNMTILEFLHNDSISEIKAKGNNSLAVTQSGKVYYWPVELPTGERIYKPAELRLPPKINITTAACGYNFAVLVAKNGLVFTFGKNNQFGQLGHGDTTPRAIPTLVETLKNESEIVVSASCGFKHVVCKTKLGKVYTWGWGKKGQLGHGELEDEYTPRMINFGQVGIKARILQVQAGFKHSVMVLDNRKVLWWGTNATLECQASPVEVNLYKKVPGYNKDFIPVKVLCTWSKTLNITYISMADTRTVDLKPTIKTKIFTTLASKMEENAAFHDANLPYIDVMAKHFSSRAMKNIPKDLKSSRNGARASVMDYQVQLTAPDEPIYAGPSCFESLQKVRRASRSPVPFETIQNLQRGSCIVIGGSRGTDTFKNLSALAGKPRNSEYISSVMADLDSLKQKSDLASVSESPKEYNKSQSSNVNSSPQSNKQRGSEVSNSNFLPPDSKGSPRKSEYRNAGDLISEINNKQKKSTTTSKSKGTSPTRKNDKNSLEALNQKLAVIKDKMREIMATPVEKWSKADAEFITMAASPEMLKFWQNANI